MCYQSMLVMCVMQVTLVVTAPLSMFLQSQQQLPLQQLPLQQLAMMQLQQQQQMMRPFQQPYDLNMPQPVYMILPMNTDVVNIPLMSDKLLQNKNEKNTKLKNKEELESHNDDEDENASVIIDAANSDDETDAQSNQMQVQRVLMLDPQTGRFSIGQIIGSIPFLPFEINVPDTVAWAWNGLSNIIAAIGTQLPFRQRLQDGSASMQQMPGLKLSMNPMESNKPLMKSPIISVPIIVIPMPMPMGSMIRS